MSWRREAWSTTWLEVAEVMSRRSRCVRAQVGAVIVTPSQRIVSTGYNGPAATLERAEYNQCDSWCPRARGEAPLDASYDACPALHAESNAIAYVDRSAVEGGTIYVTRACCMGCAKLISNSGLCRVVMRVTPEDEHRHPEVVAAYFRDCGIEIEVVK